MFKSKQIDLELLFSQIIIKLSDDSIRKNSNLSVVHNFHCSFNQVVVMQRHSRGGFPYTPSCWWFSLLTTAVASRVFWVVFFTHRYACGFHYTLSSRLQGLLRWFSLLTQAAASKVFLGGFPYAPSIQNG